MGGRRGGGESRDASEGGVTSAGVRDDAAVVGVRGPGRGRRVLLRGGGEGAWLTAYGLRLQTLRPEAPQPPELPGSMLSTHVCHI